LCDFLVYQNKSLAYFSNYEICLIFTASTKSMISTGLQKLDTYLGGGLKEGLITDIFGQNATGKSQLAFQICINALKSGKVFALGLDVYNGEPDIHPQYLNLDNVFILPHLGSATEKTRFAMADLAINNIEEYFKTGKCKNTVN